MRSYGLPKSDGETTIWIGCFCRCALILGIGVIPYNDRLKLMMAGVHEILGYATDMTEYCASGEILADQFIGRSSGTARTYYGPGCANEYLPGYGPYGSEPAHIGVTGSGAAPLELAVDSAVW